MRTFRPNGLKLRLRDIAGISQAGAAMATIALSLPAQLQPGRRVLTLGDGEAPIAGELAREFELPDSTRVPRRLSELISHGRLVLLFYRGNW